MRHITVRETQPAHAPVIGEAPLRCRAELWRQLLATPEPLPSRARARIMLYKLYTAVMGWLTPAGFAALRRRLR